jgi:hypothetical protein
MRIGALTGDPLEAARSAYASLVLVLMVGGLVAVIRRNRAGLGIALALAGLGPPAALIAIESLRPIWNTRYTLVGLPLLLTLAAAGAVTPIRRAPTFAALLAVALIGGQVHGLVGQSPPPREDWRAVRDVVHREAGRGDIVLGAVQAISEYYLGPIVTLARALQRSPARPERSRRHSAREKRAVSR